MLAVYKREVKAYLFSPIAYVLLALFMIFTGYFFFMLLMYRIGDFMPILSQLSSVLIIIIPLLTMRLLTEERKGGTETLLLTAPTSLSGIVLGKYLAALTVYMALIAVSWLFPVVLVFFGGAVTVQLVGCYVAYFFMGASLIAFGLFASSLTENQIVAAIITFVGTLLVQISQYMATSVGGVPGKVLEWLSLFSRFDGFLDGIFDIVPIVYFLSFAAVFVFLTVRMIEKRRWSQG
jgi:ABC-2 type transport system permease protein